MSEWTTGERTMAPEKGAFSCSGQLIGPMRTEGIRTKDMKMHAFAALVALTFAEVASASPFSVVVTGELDLIEGVDGADLDGASLRIVYSADTTDTPTSMGFHSGRAFSYFDVFTMEVEFTNRPNDAPDITGLVTTNDPIAGNFFPPRTENDDFVFDSRFFDAQGTELMVDLIQIDFGSQSYFPGTDPVPDLSFFEPLIGSSLTSGPFGGVEFYHLGIRYDLTGTTIEVAGALCPWDCGAPVDGEVSVVDFLALLAQWGTEDSCDFDGDGVGLSDFLTMLANWGPCLTALQIQLQNIRSAIALYNEQNPDTQYDATTVPQGDTTFWDPLIQGGYLPSAPINPLAAYPDLCDPSAVYAAPMLCAAWVWAEAIPGDSSTLNLYAVNEYGDYYDGNGDGYPD